MTGAEMDAIEVLAHKVMGGEYRDGHVKALAEAAIKLIIELKSADRFAAGVCEALNSGDGSYKP